MQKANREQWKKDRDAAISRGIARSQQKAAEATADNATIAARIKTKLLKRLEAEIDSLPDNIGSETRQTARESGNGKKNSGSTKEVSKSYRLRDLTAAYRDLTEDLPKNLSIEVNGGIMDEIRRRMESEQVDG